MTLLSGCPGGHSFLGSVAELLEYRLDIRTADQVTGDPSSVARAVAGIERGLTATGVLHDALHEQALGGLRRKKQRGREEHGPSSESSVGRLRRAQPCVAGSCLY